MFDYTERVVMDDSEFAPLIGCVADAVEEYCKQEGLSSRDALEAREEIVRFAIGVYVKLCKQHDPEWADEQEDEESFRYLMDPDQN
jgi:hypothetical protein